MSPGGKASKEASALDKSISDDERRDLARRLTLAAQEHVCPAMVGLVGPGTEEGYCGAWPMLVLLGRYAEAVIDAADG